MGQSTPVELWETALREAGLEQDVVHWDYVDPVLPRQIAEPDSLGAGGDY